MWLVFGLFWRCGILFLLSFLLSVLFFFQIHFLNYQILNYKWKQKTINCDEISLNINQRGVQEVKSDWVLGLFWRCNICFSLFVFHFYYLCYFRNKKKIGDHLLQIDFLKKKAINDADIRQIKLTNILFTRFYTKPRFCTLCSHLVS